MNAWRTCANSLASAGRRAQFHPGFRIPPAFPALLGFLALCSAGPACAQVAGRVSLATDDRFRGHSLSEGRPVLSLDLSYDMSGAYFGLSATGVDTAHDGIELLGGQAYAGYVKALAPGRSLDVGLFHSSYSEYYSGGTRVGYTEAYVGLITGHLSSHLYYSPNYFGRGAATLYGEVDGVLHPAPRWRATAHLGLLERVDGPHSAIRSGEYDWRLGIGTTLHGVDAQLAWTGLGPDRDYYAGHTQPRRAVVFALGRSF